MNGMYLFREKAAKTLKKKLS